MQVVSSQQVHVVSSARGQHCIAVCNASASHCLAKATYSSLNIGDEPFRTTTDMPLMAHWERVCRRGLEQQAPPPPLIQSYCPSLEQQRLTLLVSIGNCCNWLVESAIGDNPPQMGQSKTRPCSFEHDLIKGRRPGWSWRLSAVILNGVAP